MKKIKSLIIHIVFVSTLVLHACSKSNEPVLPSIVGTWRISNSSITDCTNSSNNTTQDFSGTNITYVFSGTSTSGTFTYGGFNSRGTITPYSGTYTITTSNNMTLSGGINYTAAITVTATTLTFKSPSNYAAGCLGTTTLTRL